MVLNAIKLLCPKVVMDVGCSKGAEGLQQISSISSQNFLGGRSTSCKLIHSEVHCTKCVVKETSASSLKLKV